MGGKISKRGSYNLQKREEEYKKRKGLTIDDRASSFISLSQAQVYEDELNSPIREVPGKSTNRTNVSENVPPKKISIAFNPPSSERDDYSSPDDEKIYENILQDNDSDTTKFGSPVSSGFEEQVPRKGSTHSNPEPSAAQRRRKTWNNPENEDCFSKREKGSSQSSSQYEEVVQHELGGNWKELLSGTFWADEDQYVKVEAPNKAEEEQSLDDQNHINRKNKEPTSESELNHSSITNNYSEEQSKQNDFGEDWTISVSEEQVPITEIKSSLVTNYIRKNSESGEKEEQSQNLIKIPNPKNPPPQATLNEEHGRYEDKHEEQVLIIETSSTNSAIQTNQTEEDIQENQKDRIINKNEPEDEDLINIEKGAHYAIKANYQSDHINQEESLIITCIKNNEEKNSASENVGENMDDSQLEVEYQDQDNLLFEDKSKSPDRKVTFQTAEEQIELTTTTLNEATEVTQTIDNHADMTSDLSNNSPLQKHKLAKSISESSDVYYALPDDELMGESESEEQESFYDAEDFEEIQLEVSDDIPVEIVNDNLLATKEIVDIKCLDEEDKHKDSECAVEDKPKNSKASEGEIIIKEDGLMEIPVAKYKAVEATKVETKSWEESKLQTENKLLNSDVGTNSKENNEDINDESGKGDFLEDSAQIEIETSGKISGFNEDYLIIFDEEHRKPNLSQSDDPNTTSDLSQTKVKQNLNWNEIFQEELDVIPQKESVFVMLSAEEVGTSNIFNEMKTNSAVNNQPHQGSLELSANHSATLIDLSDGRGTKPENEDVHPSMKKAQENHQKYMSQVEIINSFEDTSNDPNNEKENLFNVSKITSTNSSERNSALRKQNLEASVDKISENTPSQTLIDITGDKPIQTEFNDIKTMLNQQTTFVIGESSQYLAQDNAISENDAKSVSNLTKDFNGRKTEAIQPSTVGYESSRDDLHKSSVERISEDEKADSTKSHEPSTAALSNSLVEDVPEDKKVNPTKSHEPTTTALLQSSVEDIPEDNKIDSTRSHEPSTAALSNYSLEDVLEDKKSDPTKSHEPSTAALLQSSVENIPKEKKVNPTKLHERTISALLQSSVEDVPEDKKADPTKSHEPSTAALSNSSVEDVPQDKKTDPTRSHESSTAALPKSSVEDVPEHKKANPTKAHESSTAALLKFSDGSEELTVLPKKPTSLSIPSSDPTISSKQSHEKTKEKLFDVSPSTATPEEIAQNQMKLWGEQDDEQVEEVICQINTIMVSIDKAKGLINNLGSSEKDKEVQGEMYQTLIKIMREVNSIDNHNFNERVIDLQHRALNEVHGCLKELQLKKFA